MMLASVQLKMLRNTHPMKSISRRNFLKSSFAGAAACGLSPHSWSQVLGANEDIRVAVVGLNGRGGSHLDEFSFDPAREKFVDNARADQLLTRAYRAPFAVP